MSTVLSLLLLAGLPDIANVDWSTESGSRILSLRPGTNDSEGSVWLIQRDAFKKGATEAYFGTFSYSENDGFPKLRVDFSRKWVQHDDGFGNRAWAFDSRYYTNDNARSGATIEVAKSTSGITFSVLEVSTTSRSGNTTGKEVLGTTFHFRANETIKLKQLTSEPFFAEDMPPGYLPRTKWKRHIRSNPSEVFGVKLFSQDWYGWTRDTLDNRHDAFFWISMRAGDRWDEGDAWLIGGTLKESKLHFAAGRGKFEIQGHSNKLLETLVLQLSLPRCYVADLERGGVLKWSVMKEDRSDILLKPCGMTWHLPLTDRSISRTDQRMYVDEIYYIDNSGNRRRKTYSTGFLNLNTQEDVPESFGLFSPGMALAVVPGEPQPDGGSRTSAELKFIKLIQASPPPGFELRSTDVPETVARPQLPDPAEQSLNLAKAAYQEKKYSVALRHYDAVLVKDPDNAEVLNSIAWMLATAPDAKVRDGEVALDLAMRACRLTDYKNYLFVDTLAAAAAETGAFSMAVKWQLEAVRLSPDDQKADLESRVQLFKNRRPYRLP